MSSYLLINSRGKNIKRLKLQDLRRFMFHAEREGLPILISALQTLYYSCPALLSKPKSASRTGFELTLYLVTLLKSVKST
jgi:hypothetical protein